VDAVIHAAARAHILNAQHSDFELYHETNARGTARLVQAAASASVSRFIYLSSIKVIGEGRTGAVYTATDLPNPQDPYGESKWQGEQALLAHAGPMRAAIVRPPLVYGPGVRANFLRLLKWVDKGIPLPLGAVNNRRSLVSIWNLCDLLKHLLHAQLSSNRAWLVSDGEDLATPELIRRIAHAMGKSASLLSVPAGLLTTAGTLLGRGAEVRRLCGSLTVDSAATCRELGWSQPMSVDEALQLTVSWYMREGRSSGA
jgi:nucleoside-diphosphate-sugar epimerase